MNLLEFAHEVVRDGGVSIVPIAASDCIVTSECRECKGLGGECRACKGSGTISENFRKKPAYYNGNADPSLFRWDPFKIRRMNLQEIDRYFRRSPNIGFIMGAVSGYSEAIDFDREGALDAWKEILIENGHGDLLDKLYIQSSATAGRFHVVYRCPSGIEGNLKLAWYFDHEDLHPVGHPKAGEPKRKAIVETRGEGGYIVGAPSEGYALVQGSILALQDISAEERGILLHAARMLDEAPDAPPSPKTHKGQQAGEITPWADFEARGAWSEILEPHGWTYLRHRGPVVHWVRPGKSERSTGATTGLGRGGELMRVFTSSASPLEGDKTYTKFEAYMVLNHSGDVSKAIRALSQEGYGTPPRRQEPKETPGTRTEREDADPEGVDTIVEGRKFRVYELGELWDMPAKPMLVDGLIGVQDRWMLFGPSGNGKTFLIIDLLVCMAVGGTWAGQFECVRPLNVLYCTGEGKYGIPKRLRAAVAYSELLLEDVAPRFRVMLDVPQVFDLAGQRSILKFAEEQAKEDWQPDVIVLDTLNKASLGSDEKSNSDASLVCDGLAQVGDRLGCSVGLVHHTGHGEPDRPRGASAYVGDMDLALRSTYDQDMKEGIVHLFKPKDVKPFPDFRFALVPYMDTVVVNFDAAGFEPGESPAIAAAIATMNIEGRSRWWSPSEIAVKCHGYTAEAIAVSLKREVNGRGNQSLVVWDGVKSPPRYRLKRD